MQFENTIGLAIFMPNCSFQVELDQYSIDEAVNEIEESLTRLYVEEDDDTRVSAVMQNVVHVSMALCNEELDSIDAINEMAFSFMYVYRKRNIEVLENVRGILGFLTEDSVHFSTCVERYKYDESIEKSQQFHDHILGEGLVDLTPPRPTLH